MALTKINNLPVSLDFQNGRRKPILTCYCSADQNYQELVE